MSTQRKRPRQRRRKAVATMAPVAAPPAEVVSPTLDLSKARARLTESVNRVSYRGERIVIQKHGRPVAALVPVEDLALIRELEDRIDLEDARKALAEAKGKLIPWGTVKRRLGL
jgi:prevent-host-death family protein